MKQALRIIIPFVCILVTIAIVTFSYAAFSTNMLIGAGGVLKNYHDPVYINRVSFKRLVNATEDYNPEYSYKYFTVYNSLDRSSVIQYNVVLKNETNTDYKIKNHYITKNNPKVSVNYDAISIIGTIIPANSTITLQYSITCGEDTTESDVIKVDYEWEPYSITYPSLDYDSTKDVEVLTIGDEEFYVISRDASNIQAITKNNLYVGKVYNNSVLTKTINNYDNGYGRQSDNPGTTEFTQENLGNRQPAYGSNIYDSRTTLYNYVEDYKTYLNHQYGVTVNASVLAASRLNDLGCNITIGDRDNTNDSCTNGPDWLFESTYWTQTNDTYTKLYVVNSNKTITTVDYNNQNSVGLKPMITIPTSSVTINSTRP